MAVKTLSQSQARELQAAEEARRVRAARQAAKVDVQAEALPTVTVRVLPLGDGKISMGDHAPGIGEVHYEAGETFPITQDIADVLQARGYVEIVSGE